MKTTSFFGSPEEDQHLEEVNQIFWRSLFGHVRAEVGRRDVSTILDVGCHHGGLLELFAGHFKPQRIIGLEPLEHARQRAGFRLMRQQAEVHLLEPSEWPSVEDGSVDLVLCHEVVHLVPDLDAILSQIARVLRSGDHASAYVVFGSHSENPLWPNWKSKLIELGHEVFDHTPFDVLSAASRSGLDCAIRPLRRDGWVFYNPDTAQYRYPSAEAMFDHQYRHKLLFRFKHSVNPR